MVLALTGFRRRWLGTSTAAVTKLHQAAKRSRNSDGELLELFQTVTRSLEIITPRQLALVAWSAARLHFNFSCYDARQIPQQILIRAAELDAQGVSMVMWSLAVLSHSEVEPLLASVVLKLPELSIQGVSNTLWACAVLRQERTPMMNALQRQPMLSKVAFASSQAASNIVWATARLSWAGSPIQEAAAQLACHRVLELRPAEAAAIVWAIAGKSRPGPRARRALDLITQQAVSCPEPKIMAACVWSMATLLVTAKPLWEQLQAAVEAVSKQAKGFKSQELSHVFWGLASVSLSSSSPLWQALAHAALSQIQELSSTELAAISWAMAATRCVWPTWSTALAASRAHDTPNLRTLASLAWSWATLEFESGFLSSSVNEQACKLVKAYADAFPQLPAAACPPGSARSSCNPCRAELHKELIDPLLQLSWAFSFAKVDSTLYQSEAKILLRHVGSTWDKEFSLSTAPIRRTSTFDEPQVLLQKPGVVLVLKPPGWEVDGGKDAGQARPDGAFKLSTYLQHCFPCRQGGATQCHETHWHFTAS
ncbi:unnamed protein product [Effrenium voratum]|uniref:RAP domain-containing protein n=1 Tax=Effrenium voratum TaxID=2562239 RepID=A0AA36IBY4_9DINO|nr:unnamed protein product [Effrenium voratum]CAJ1435387.1 unnamed protein product [Effrenium voratum]